MVESIINHILFDKMKSYIQLLIQVHIWQATRKAASWSSIVTM